MLNQFIMILILDIVTKYMYSLYYLIEIIFCLILLHFSYTLSSYENIIKNFFNCVQKNDWCLLEYLVLYRNIWYHLTLCKRIRNVK